MTLQFHKLSQSDLNSVRRQSLLGYAKYDEQVSQYIDTIGFVTSNLDDPEYARRRPIDRLMLASGGRATDSVEYLSLQYTAGLSLEQLRTLLPHIVNYWEDYAKYNHEFMHSPLHDGHLVAHIPLANEQYWTALRLACLAILLGHTDQLHRLAALWDYVNPKMDALLERFVQPFVPNRPPLPDEYLRHLPYRKLQKVFDAEPVKRPVLMAKYLDEWYEASRREVYYNTAGTTATFVGYWSFEAAAITFLLGIDDSIYRDHEFYPKDLVDFARSLDEKIKAESAGRYRLVLRVLPGEPCPKSGYWHVWHVPDSRRKFEQGDVMPDIKGEMGATIWYYMQDNQA